MCGDELAKEILKIRPDIPIILCTGYYDLISEKKARKIGIKSFIFKPIILKNIAQTGTHFGTFFLYAIYSSPNVSSNLFSSNAAI